jgi:hypothetical protein
MNASRRERHRLLVFLAAACVAGGASTGCAVHHAGGYGAGGAPSYARHDGVYQADGALLVFDSTWNGYSVRGHPHHYFHGGHYYRYAGGRWQRAPRFAGPWSLCDERALPHGLRGRGGRHDADRRDDHAAGPPRRDSRLERRDPRRESARERHEPRREMREPRAVHERSERRHVADLRRAPSAERRHAADVRRAPSAESRGSEHQRRAPAAERRETERQRLEPAAEQESEHREARRERRRAADERRDARGETGSPGDAGNSPRLDTRRARPATR